MSKRRTPINTPGMRRAIRDLKTLISKEYPGTTYRVRTGGEPFELFLYATVDTDNIYDVYTLVSGKLADFQVDDKLPLRVQVRPTEERAREIVEETMAYRRSLKEAGAPAQESVAS